MGLEPEDYVAHWYHIATVKKTYDLYILGDKGPDQWPPIAYEPILPPLKRRGPRRPQKNRKKEHHQVKSSGNKKKLSKSGQKLRCKNCQEIGHNKSKCQNPYVPPSKKKAIKKLAKKAETTKNSIDLQASKKNKSAAGASSSGTVEKKGRGVCV
ncbi:hypothetical protein FRX31_027664 [Thalictrum thalictroides]|uniref:Uncharacterized protein n=1 Tax=Thalictrum thalictroides TaxID=46969 RepID=A0A7J6VCC0_THATH|nr:hypothetical protein FRX31_027664 [Thalictrum thalictroides]